MAIRNQYSETSRTNDLTFARTLSNKGILQLHPSSRIKNHNTSNEMKPSKYLEPKISKTPFDTSLNLIAPFFYQMKTARPSKLHKIIENYKNKKISLHELEYEIKISEKINTELLYNNNNYYYIYYY